MMKLLEHPREILPNHLKLGHVPVNKLYMGTIKKLVRNHYSYLDLCDRFESEYECPMPISQDEIDSWTYLSHDIMKKQAILIEIGNGLPLGTTYYIDIDRLKNWIDMIKMHRALYFEEYVISKHSLIMSTKPVGAGSLFVDHETLHPLFNDIPYDEISVKQLKKITSTLRK